MGEGQSLQQMGLEQLDIFTEKNIPWSLTYKVPQITQNGSYTYT